MKKTFIYTLFIIGLLSISGCGSTPAPAPDAGERTEEQRSSAEANQEPEFELVDITTENWQEYFEIKEWNEFTKETDDWGDVTAVTCTNHCSLFLKEEYLDDIEAYYVWELGQEIKEPEQQENTAWYEENYENRVVCDTLNGIWENDDIINNGIVNKFKYEMDVKLIPYNVTIDWEDETVTFNEKGVITSFFNDNPLISERHNYQYGFSSLKERDNIEETFKIEYDMSMRSSSSKLFVTEIGYSTTGPLSVAETVPEEAVFLKFENIEITRIKGQIPIIKN